MRITRKNKDFQTEKLNKSKERATFLTLDRPSIAAEGRMKVREKNETNQMRYFSFDWVIFLP